ncbi:MAG TPA: beta-galactosidase [Kiritimatiellia bacterium]|nr:beta-galactosidase [Kiritimatiellia bacterium]
MNRIVILADPAISPLPSYTAEDALRALPGARMIARSGLAGLRRTDADVLVLPYLDGELGGAPLDGMIRFHEQGGGLLFLGDTPHTGRSYPYRNSLAPELRMTRCRDPLTLTGLTERGQALLGDLPDLHAMLNREMPGVRTSAFAPDECHNLFTCRAGFKDLSPVVFIERRHPRFLGARVAVAGFDGAEPRENIMGVCRRPWTFNPGLLTRDWAGADALVARLAKAVLPEPAGLAIELEPVVTAGVLSPVVALTRIGDATPQRIPLPTHSAFAGPELFTHTHNVDGRVLRVERTRFGCLPGEPPPLAFGFSIFRAFRSNRVDDAYRDFFRTTARLGMQYARLNLAWEDLEPEPGRYCWDIPDQLLELAASENLPAFFWVFATARGSGLSESGLPAWALREPSIDRDGRPGNFPCIWSPFYRERYFAFLAALAQRYARDPRLHRFVFDFGNSDFPYTYHYYGDRGDLFDYSPHEQAAFAHWLERRGFPLAELGRRWGCAFSRHADVPVPLSEQREAWMLYDEFRVWGVHQGIKEAVAVIHRHAPAKAPPDFPGHGLGSISDLGTYAVHAQARHWAQTLQHPPELVEAHNTGPQWGGEPWQVGGRYPDYDDALFQSIRLEADYLTIPGPDLGVWEEDIARVAMVRRSLAGARRLPPRIAIMDRMNWNDWASLANVGARLDQPVDLVTRTCRYDYAEYALFVLPPDEVEQTSRGPRSMLPLDEGYARDLLGAVERGLRILLFPRTGFGDPMNPMRRIWGLDTALYGERRPRTVDLPVSWGGGQLSGCAASIRATEGDEVLLRDTDGEPVLLFRSRGAGGFLLAGYDAQPDSFDGDFRYDRAETLAAHSLVRLIQHLGLGAERLRTGQACCYKEYLFRGDRDVILLYSHHAAARSLEFQFKPRRAARRVFDLAFGIPIPFHPFDGTGWYHAQLELPPGRGLYLVIE